ncbi:MAG: hypothetical protein QM756_22865 [Polyangiaceae bacterium]
MLWRILLYLAIGLFALKFFARARFRELAARLDRVINATLIAIALVYSAQLIYWLSTR